MHAHIYIYAYIHYTWLACKTNISEEVRNHRSDVISRLFVVLRPHTHYFPTTHSIAFMLRAMIKTVTNCAALNWFWTPKRFNLCLSEITNSRDMTSDRCFLISSEMSVLHASHVWWPIPRWWLNPTMKNLVWDHSDHIFWAYICDLSLWIGALLHSLWETKIFRKSQIEALWCPKSAQSSAICDRFDYCRSINAMEWMARGIWRWYKVAHRRPENI